MKFVEEIVVEAFLPTVRSMLAQRLRDRGFTQREIADAIGVSQSAVSKYIHGEVEPHPEIAADQRVRTRVTDIADELAAGEADPTRVLLEFEVLIRELEAPGDVLSRLHESAVPELAAYDGAFRVHDPDSRVRRRERVRSSVRGALRTIEQHPRFVTLIPQVGTNVVEIDPAGRTVDDVVGVPGRIIDVEGRTMIPGDPTFGVSGHLASVLIAARESGSEATGAINIKYDETILARLGAADHQLIAIEGTTNVIAAVREAVNQQPSATVIAQHGGVGIEPIVYILAENARTAVEVALGILD